MVLTELPLRQVTIKIQLVNTSVDAIIVDNFNKRFYLTEKVVEVSQSRPSASLTIENNNATTGTFDAVVRNIVAPNGLKEILVPSWSLVNGQDDLVWHKGSKQADGSYRVTIKLQTINIQQVNTEQMFISSIRMTTVSI